MAKLNFGPAHKEPCDEPLRFVRRMDAAKELNNNNNDDDHDDDKRATSSGPEKVSLFLFPASVRDLLSFDVMQSTE